MFVQIIIASLILLIIYVGVVEKFTDTIFFLSIKETQEFISFDEDQFIKTMTKYDIYARTQQYIQQLYINRIHNVCSYFSIYEKYYISNVVNKINKKLRNVNIPWKFAKTEGDVYENGFPHTRKDIIFLTSKHLKYTEEAFIKLLIHEKIHIYQRYNKAKMGVYLKKLGYTIHCHKETFIKRRSNPDLDDYIYKDPSGKIMICEYQNEHPKNLMDVMHMNTKYEHPYEMLSYISENLFY
jgi:hypothetical protein